MSCSFPLYFIPLRLGLLLNLELGWHPSSPVSSCLLLLQFKVTGVFGSFRQQFHRYLEFELRSHACVISALNH